MKYLILVPDGCADRPLPALGGKTPLEAADLENINALARISQIGLVKTIPDGVAPGSDAANLAVMGFDPTVCLTGRSPLEAVSMGIDLSDTDVAFRANLVTLKGDGAYETLTLQDHSSGDISNEEARTLIEFVEERLGGAGVHFYAGVSYRHAMIVDRGESGYTLTPPHDILGRATGPWLPRADEGAAWIADLMRKSYDLLREHPVNLARVQRGLNPGNSLWIWGQGKRPRLSSFYEKYGIKGSVISAVDLVKGIGICAGLGVRVVEGATGTLSTNFAGKAESAAEAFRSGEDFVYIHVEAPDECGHQGDIEGKIEAMKRIDRQILGPLAKRLKEGGEPYRILIVPDHRTPIEIRTHSAEPVPFVFFDSEKPLPPEAWKAFSERAGERGLYFDSGRALADCFFGRGL